MSTDSTEPIAAEAPIAIPHEPGPSQDDAAAASSIGSAQPSQSHTPFPTGSLYSEKDKVLSASSKSKHADLFQLRRNEAKVIYATCRQCGYSGIKDAYSNCRWTNARGKTHLLNCPGVDLKNPQHVRDLAKGTFIFLFLSARMYMC